ncbi:osmotically inducible protein C [Shewanella sp. Choline-02u-19]|uniref:OsmC family protein n=1 Tax=unclassified Shewanella TaxID=196818 RepID=UPI000C33B862|nr:MULTISPECIES: OsmC family protein [unclassified Shewanella]PKG57915.1 osmotically inducible protein C [Shewanella sp. GutDb-MelDb]PKG75062.1 osmotically inducible protein C [Shewanella sp. GutCb]PKH54847.1 osmotically inducible protein C [Shewanella sp. Bg11-22]PKI26619.1 osmotically inducible protein C [Shewanella sp. Choline-02u-19]
MADKIVAVNTQMGEGWKVSAQIREHLLVIDQPTAGNEGANPLETFVFSLAGCISTIAKMVAREQKIDLQQFDMSMKAQLNSAGLLGKPSDDPVGFKVIDIIATMDAMKDDIQLTDEQKSTFLDTVCHRCPVHDNLLNPTLVTHAVA